MLHSIHESLDLVRIFAVKLLAQTTLCVLEIFNFFQYQARHCFQPLTDSTITLLDQTGDQVLIVAAEVFDLMRSDKYLVGRSIRVRRMCSTYCKGVKIIRPCEDIASGLLDLSQGREVINGLFDVQIQRKFQNTCDNYQQNMLPENILRTPGCQLTPSHVDPRCGPAHNNEVSGLKDVTVTTSTGLSHRYGHVLLITFPESLHVRGSGALAQSVGNAVRLSASRL